MKHHEIPWELSRVPDHLKIVTSKKALEQIWKLRESEFSKHYPGVTDFDDDPYDPDACILCSENDEGDVISTGRIVFDKDTGLPADEIIKSEVDKLRQKGLRIAEPSKFAIAKEAKGVLPSYMLTYYEIAKGQEIDSLIFICKKRSVGFYRRAVGAKIIRPDIGYSYGTRDTFSLLEWNVDESKPFLSQWLKEEIQ